MNKMMELLKNELIEYLQNLECITQFQVGYVAGYMDTMWTLQEELSNDSQEPTTPSRMPSQDALANVIGKPIIKHTQTHAEPQLPIGSNNE